MHNVMGYRERLPTKDLDRLILSEDEPSEPSVSTELEVRVDKPEKIMSTMDTYITFRVVTKVGSFVQLRLLYLLISLLHLSSYSRYSRLTKVIVKFS